MNFLELQEIKSKYQVEEIAKERKPLYAARNRFVRDFPRERIENLSIDEFIEGKGDTNTFCYGIERTLDGLGRIRGSFATKFGVYYSKDDGQYMFAKKFGETYRKAFNAIKIELLALIEAGATGNLDALVKNKISPMFKGKILATYFPERYLNVFDNEHLTHYLRVFDLDTETLVRQDPILKREALVRFKNEDPDMKSWDLDIFGKFLYQYFPPQKKKADSDDDDEFPTTDHYAFIDLNIDYDAESTPSKRKGMAPKTNYEREARKYRKYGDRGEKIVMRAEIDRLMKEFGLSEKQAMKKVSQVSRKSDSYGYDILSVNSDGSARYIEVKATTGKVGDVDFYYTENEYEKAKEYGRNYFIYIVYEIKSIEPKIWIIRNPFLSNTLEMRPVQYKVTVHTK